MSRRNRCPPVQCGPCDDEPVGCPTGPTGPRGGTGPTGPCCTGPTGSSGPHPCNLSLYTPAIEGFVLNPNDDVAWSFFAIPLDPDCFDVLVGTITIKEGGTYELIYGLDGIANGGDDANVQAILNGAPLPSTSVTYINGGLDRFVTIATQLVAAPGDTLSIRNLGAGVLTITSGSGGALGAFLTLKKISS